ncbi:MAG: hypothetical protein ACKN86_12390, partial [Crocinitomicaceae bacterium]
LKTPIKLANFQIFMAQSYFLIEPKFIFLQAETNIMKNIILGRNITRSKTKFSVNLTECGTEIK